MNLPRCRVTKSEVTRELFIHHAFWCPKIPLMKTFSWCLDAGKLKTEQKLIVIPCLLSPPYLFWRKIGAQSPSAKFLNWGDHVNSVPDLAASPPWRRWRKTNCLLHFRALNLKKILHESSYDGVSGTDNDEQLLKNLSKCLSSLAARSVLLISKRQYTSCKCFFWTPSPHNRGWI